MTALDYREEIKNRLSSAFLAGDFGRWRKAPEAVAFSLGGTICEPGELTVKAAEAFNF